MRHRGGSSAVTSLQPASHAIRTSAGSTLPARVRVGGLESDSSPHSMPRRVRVDSCVVIPINVAETANVSLDMTAAAVDAAPIGCPAKQVSRRASANVVDATIHERHPMTLPSLAEVSKNGCQSVVSSSFKGVKR